MKSRHLDTREKGQFVYNYKDDILTFKTRDRDYKKSIEFGNFIADIDTEDYITGIRIFDASKILNIDRIALNNIQNFEFRASIEHNVVTINLQFTAFRRNKAEILRSADFIRDAVNTQLEGSIVVSTA